MDRIDFLNRKINKLWDKKVSNASDAHFRAQEISRLQERIESIRSKKPTRSTCL